MDPGATLSLQDDGGDAPLRKAARALARRDTEATRQKVRYAATSGKARISITGPNSALTVGRFGDHLRFSVSVFNNDEDVSKVVEILS